MEKSTTNMRIVDLKKLHEEMEKAWEEETKFVTILDHTNQCEIFFKYQGTILDIYDTNFPTGENLCRTWLSNIKYAKNLTFNFEDLPYKSIFSDEWFPLEALNGNNYKNYHFFEPFRKKFPQFTEEIWPHKEFKLVFLFKKNNILAELAQYTRLLDVYNGEEYLKKIEEEKAKNIQQASTAAKEEKKEETKVNNIGANAGTKTRAKPGATAKPTVSTNSIKSPPQASKNQATASKSSGQTVLRAAITTIQMDKNAVVQPKGTNSTSKTTATTKANIKPAKK